MNISDIAILIPAYEPDNKLNKLIDELLNCGFFGIYIINDGSGKDYYSIFEKCKTSGCIVKHHETNKGKGRALKTGFEIISAEMPECKGIITADSDGQHTVKDILKVADSLINNNCCLWMGCRDFKEQNVPFKSRIGNLIIKKIFTFFYGCRISDTQTGLRGFSCKNIENFINTDGERFDYEMNVLIKCQKMKLPIKETKIETIYINDNSGTHFKAFSDSIRICSIFLKFILSSCLSAILDYLLFYIFYNISSILLFSIFAARAMSSFFNFYVNRSLIFCHTDDIKREALKYYVLVIVIAALSYSFTALLAQFKINVYIAKILVDLFLFIISYYVQQTFVFKSK